MKRRGLLIIIMVCVLLFQGLIAIPQNSQAYSLNRVIVLADPDIIQGIQDNLNQYIYDLDQLGYWPEIVSQEWSSPEQVRDFLAAEYEEGLIGIVIIGDILSALYEEEKSEDFFVVPGIEEFPIDLFYMDLNGDWLDTDGNGIYDKHTGETAPEIWVGRITATSLSGDAVALTNRYLDKIHRYRTGEIAPNDRALLYVDDDWAYWANTWRSDLSLLYNDVIMVANPALTNADHYKNELARDYEWIQVCAHSSEDSHHFKVLKVWQLRGVTSSDIMDIGPSAYYYNLFACSAAKYTSQDYIAGCYIFSDSLGVAAIGSTKTGAMKNFYDFYGPLSEGYSMGEAFLQWFRQHGENDPDWYYGLTIIGDPTLGPRVEKLSNGDENQHNQKPNVTIQSPENGDVLKSPVTIKGTAWDDKQLVSVWVRIDSRDWQQAKGTTSWSYYWDIEEEPSGSHTIFVRSYDGELYSDLVSISVVLETQIPENGEPNGTSENKTNNPLFGLSLSFIYIILAVTAMVVAVVVSVFYLKRNMLLYHSE